MLQSILKNQTEFDFRLDYIPVASTFTNIYYIFQKCTYPTPPIGTLDHHYELLQAKSFTRCIILLVPILGNITIGIGDFLSDVKILQLKLIKAGLISLPRVSLRLQKDDDILKAIIEKDPSEIRFILDPAIVTRLFSTTAIFPRLTTNDLHPSLKNNHELICRAIYYNPNNLRYITDPQTVVKVFQMSPYTEYFRGPYISNLHESLKNNYEVLKAAVLQNPANIGNIYEAKIVEQLWAENVIPPKLQDLCWQLQNDPRLEKIALEKDPAINLPFVSRKETLLTFFRNRTQEDCVLSYINSRLTKETKEEIAIAAITQNPRELSCLSDPTFVRKLFCIKQGPATLQYLASSLKNNQEILKAAILNKPKDIRFIESKKFVLGLFAESRCTITLKDLHPNLQIDRDIIDAALKKDPSNLRFITDAGFVIGLFAALEEYAGVSALASIVRKKPIAITLRDVHPSFQENDDVIAAAYRANKKNIQYAAFANIITFLQHTPKALQYIEDSDIILTIFQGRSNLSEFTIDDIHESLKENPDIILIATSKGAKLHNEEGNSKKLAPEDSETSNHSLAEKTIRSLDSWAQEITAPGDIEIASKTLSGYDLV